MATSEAGPDRQRQNRSWPGLAGESPEPTRKQESNLQAAIPAALRKSKGVTVLAEGVPRRWQLKEAPRLQAEVQDRG